MTGSRATEKIVIQKDEDSFANNLISCTTSWTCAFKTTFWGEIKEAKELKKLGKGSYGAVYQYKLRVQEKINGKVQEKDKLVAVKRAISDNVKEELEALTKINQLLHPNIVYHHAAFSNKKNIILFMECVPFVLTNLVDPKKNLDFPWIIRSKIAWGLAHALDCLHKNGIIYCDLKSDNVLVDADNNAKLTDFNLANMSEKIKEPLGTILFWAPELVDSAYNFKCTSKIVNNSKSDVYGFGLLLWTIAAQDQPFEEIENLPKFKKALLENDERDIIPSNCPPMFASAITFSWMKKPEDRKTMAQLIKHFEAPTFSAQMTEYDNKNKYRKVMAQLVEDIENKAEDNKNNLSLA